MGAADRSHFADIEFFRYPPWPPDLQNLLSFIGRMPRVSRPTVYADVGAIASPFFFLFDAPVTGCAQRL